MSERNAVSPCFTPGTLIATDRGQRPVETLRRGDKVVTRDNGLKRIYWVGRCDFGYRDIREMKGLQPVLVRAGAFGEGKPARDMIVSPNHRFLVGRNSYAPRTSSEEVLVAARHLVDLRSVLPAQMLGVSYIHILCHAHEVVLADGAWTESFHPDDIVMRRMADEQRGEILSLFPEIGTLGAARRFRAARPIRKSRFES